MARGGERTFDRIAKQFFRALGLEVQRLRGANTEAAITRNVLQLVKPVAVLDVGANTGQFGASLRSLGYRGPIISFEPLPDVHTQLEAHARADGNWVVAPRVALGAEAGQAEINIAKNTASSSLLDMRQLHISAAPYSVYVGTTRVPVARLDACSVPLLPATGSVYLKIDTQGYEKEVLMGATAIMPRIVALQLELSLVQLYEGSPTLAAMVSFAEGLGFDLFNISPGFKDVRNGRLLQVDGFFVQRARLP